MIADSPAKSSDFARQCNARALKRVAANDLIGLECAGNDRWLIEEASACGLASAGGDRDVF